MDERPAGSIPHRDPAEAVPRLSAFGNRVPARGGLTSRPHGPVPCGGCAPITHPPHDQGLPIRGEPCDQERRQSWWRRSTSRRVLPYWEEFGRSDPRVAYTDDPSGRWHEPSGEWNGSTAFAVGVQVDALVDVVSVFSGVDHQFLAASVPYGVMYMSFHSTSPAPGSTGRRGPTLAASARVGRGSRPGPGCARKKDPTTGRRRARLSRVRRPPPGAPSEHERGLVAGAFVAVKFTGQDLIG